MPFSFDDEDTLPAEQLEGPVVSVRARIGLADFKVTSGPHRFGGPLALDVGGVAGGAPLVHRVLTLSLDDPLLGPPAPGLRELPLVYGFVYDGCRLKYRVTGDRRIEVMEMTPRTPAADWPYPGFPVSLPPRRFALRDEGPVEPEQVHQLTWQDVQGIDPAEGWVAIVPPSRSYGVSLWGKSGDAEMVQVIFEYDPATRVVSAYNQCS